MSYLQSVSLTHAKLASSEILQESKATDLKDRLTEKYNFF